MTDDPAVAGALEATDAFLETFNACDAAAHAATLAYPHVRLASGRVRIWQDADQAEADIKRALPMLLGQGWEHSVWDRREVIHASEGKVHLDVQFTRYRSNGSVLGIYEAVYVVVKQDERWLIQCRSSFAP